MKKMLDELKKLDEEYEVPVDFRKKVMDNIKNLETANNTENKVKYITKYVIPWASMVAVVMITVLVATKGSNDAMESSIQDFAVAQNATNSMKEYSADKASPSLALDNDFSKEKEELKINVSEANSITAEVSRTEMFDGIYNNVEDFIQSSSEIMEESIKFDLEDVKLKLDENDVIYELSFDEIMIQESIYEQNKVEEILKDDISFLIITNEEGFIKIKINGRR